MLFRSDRLRNPIDEWEGTRDVFRVENGGVEVIRDWSVNGRDKSLSRDLLLTGTPAPGSSFKIGQKGAFIVYDDYVPAGVTLEPGARWANEKSELLEVDEVSFLVREKVGVGMDPVPDLPIALAPSPPPNSALLVGAIRRWAEDVLAAWPQPFDDPAMDVLRRASPRTALAPIVGERSDAIVASLLPLRDSYLAVQGPPGTGKTYVGSVEEADAVVALARDLLGRDWSSKGVTAPLEQDNIIVVAPYNAQVETITLRLEAAGLADIPVGTVDKFQGREAAVSIISLSASSAADVLRGLEFLLLANRLNVAISRAQWASYLIYSPGLTEALPTSVAGLAQLSAFIGLVEG